MARGLSQQELGIIFGILERHAGSGAPCTLPTDSLPTHFKTVAVLLNLLGAKIQSTSNNHPFFAIFDFTVDDGFSISGTTGANDLFGDPAALAMQPLEMLLAASSLRHWQKLCNTRKLKETHFDTLAFVGHCRIVYFGFCRFTRTEGTINLRVIMPDSQSKASSADRLYTEIIAEILGPYSRDAQLLQNVYDYIMLNPDVPLPTNKQLARLFYTNQQKLKVLFRYVLQTSIYHFYNTIRLDRAMELIRDTPLPLQEVASLCGFKTFRRFSIMFNKQFGCRPGSVKRP